MLASTTIGGGVLGTLVTTGVEAVAFAQALAAQITAGLASGSLTPYSVTGSTALVNGFVLPEPASGFGGFVNLTVGTSQAVFADGADSVIIDSANAPVQLQGGAAGGLFLGGAGLSGAATNVTYTNITPSGDATSTIVILGGNNLVQTATFGTGNYNVQSGNGNDTINMLRGNASVNAGTGFNQINLGTGNNLIGSEGYDTITGAAYGTNGGSDTVVVGSGQTSINSGGSSFLVQDSSPNPLLVTLGSAVDTVNLTGAGAATVRGINSFTTLSGTGQVIGYDTFTGDAVSVSGGAVATALRGAETISALSGNNLLVAGTGNDTLVAGSGNDTLTGARGAGATALLQSGTGATAFSFTAGQGGGADTITGFKATDVLQFTGYGQPVAVSTGGGTVFTLADGTVLTVVGAVPQAGQVQVR